MSKPKKKFTRTLKPPLDCRSVRGASESTALMFHPWFLPRSTQRAIMRLVPREFYWKMRDYFNLYGCLKCEKRNVIYGGNGMCHACHANVTAKLKQCLKARFGDPTTRASTVQVNEAAAGTKLARKLLRGLIPAMRVATSLSQQEYSTRNPTTGVRV